mmetsp:Transcript_129923/g.289943  ORF Transcript_129923/g.289943 Transcript_129923/m.289943 type:complete len:453 (-) Transcript_129923:221-1579(-)
MGCARSCCQSAADKVTAPGLGRGKSGRPTLKELKKMRVEEFGDASSLKAFGADASDHVDLASGASCLKILEKNSVLVAVRIRPLNQRELNLGSQECLHQEGPSSLTLQRDGDKDCKFTFDSVLWSSVRQRDVFDRSARPLLHKVLEGYNGCLFAYGQTGSGKTFTMMGEGGADEKGLVPLLCAELFHVIAERRKQHIITVSCSVLEIYNERVKDLLVEDGGEDLQIREDLAQGGRGIFVEGICETSVQCCQDILALVSKSQARRSVGQTNMNDHSSRSHAVVTLRINSCDVEDEQKLTLTSCKLHLVDLAGSERQKATGATGDRLREGAQINLSLSSLGNVINALTEPKVSGSKASRHIPYRDSKLTRLLQDSLGGNSYTSVICNVSPARINAEETLSSLRFAERAKKIENKATVNRDPKNERLLQLMEENKSLRAKVNGLENYIALLEANY